jgi:hypothetical protein
MKLKAEKIKTWSTKWEAQLNEHVSMRIQSESDVICGITSKFIRPDDGSFVITEVLSLSMFEISDLYGKARGRFCKQNLKPYLSELH